MPRSSPPCTHYDVLKVTPDAPAEVVRAAYRSLSRLYHPDRNPGDEQATIRMAAINTSYAVLSDPAAKQEHDAWIAAERERPAKSETGGAPAVAQPARRGRVRTASRRYAWLLGLTMALAAAGSATTLFAPLLSQPRPWLEHAWEQSSRAVHAVAEQPPAPGAIVVLKPYAAPAASTGTLRLDTRLEGTSALGGGSFGASVEIR